MAKSDDPSLYESGYERMEGDRYWTHSWLTTALLQSVGFIPNEIWEPAAGRGDITRVLRDNGFSVFSSDVNMSEFSDFEGEEAESDFLSTTTAPEVNDYHGVPVKGIITNPPYNIPRGVAEKFVRHGLELLRDEENEIHFMAMLLRSEFCNAKTRRDLFGECHEYDAEVVLTKRPRWDWWFRDKPIASPRHNFSWFVWRSLPSKSDPMQLFHYAE